MTRTSNPGGAAPYSAALISLSVPSTPTRSTLTRTPRPSGTSPTVGIGRSARCTLLGIPGRTAMAFIAAFLPAPDVRSGIRRNRSRSRPRTAGLVSWTRPAGPSVRACRARTGVAGGPGPITRGYDEADGSRPRRTSRREGLILLRGRGGGARAERRGVVFQRQQPRQLLPDRHAGPMEPRLHRRHRLAEDLGDLLV